MNKAVKDIGAKQRKNNRTEKREKAQKKIDTEVKTLIAEYIPELNNKLINEEVYEFQLHKLIEILKHEYKKIDHYRMARYYLSIFINEGNKQGKYNLKVPLYIIQAKRGQIFRSSKCFENAKQLNEWVTHWSQSLTQPIGQKPSISPVNILASSLISAAFYGGLCIPEALVELVNQLTQDNKPLKKSKNLVFFDLKFNSTSQDVNYKIDDEKKPYTLRRWYVDPVSLAWINHFLHVKKDSSFESNKLDKKKCWHLIKTYMKSISPVKVTDSFNAFCTAAAGVLENHPGVKLPNTLLEYANGRLACASLTPDYHEALQNPIIHKIDNVDSTKFELKTKKFKARNLPHKKIKFRFEEQLELIRIALKLKRDKGTKNTPVLALRALKSIELSNTSKSFVFFVHWLIYLFEERKVGVSTVNTYFSKIGTLWLTYMSDLELTYLDEESFEDLYKIMIDSVHSKQSRQDKSALLKDIHSYGVTHLGFPVLTNAPTGHNGGKQNFVRVGYISEAVFIKLCESLKLVSGLDNLEARGVVCIVILAYRLGLRRGELLKLQIKDVEDSPQQWLFIRENKFSDNKTSSSLRKIPISVLLTPDENVLFTQYLTDRKRQESNDPDSLLFSEGDAFTIPYDGNYISVLVSSILKKLSGLPFTFHHFRHTALSRLHLIIERQDQVLKEVCKYKPEQITAIRKMLLPDNNNKTPRDNYWILAGIAGHSTPETTFSNYLHFVDRVLFERLYCSEISYSISQMKAISGISSNFLTRLCKSEQIPPDNIPINNLFTKVINEISPFCQKVKLSKNIEELNNESIDFLTRKITYKDCLSVLKQAEKGVSVSELVHLYQIKEDVIEGWKDNANRLAQIKTSKSKSRLFKEYSAVEGRVFQLSPQKPQSEKELSDAKTALEKIKEKYYENKGDIIWCVDYFIYNTTRSSSVIQFKVQDEFKKFIGFLIKIFPKERWSLYLELIEHDKYDKKTQIEDWGEISQGIPIIIKEKTLKKQGVFPEGRVSLYLDYPKITFIESMKEKNKGAEKYSAATLRYIFHILAIML